MTHDSQLRMKAARIARDPIKRAFDAAFGATGILITSPLWLLVAAAIKLDGGGPVFYEQDRSGLDAKPFRTWKFRSMEVDADSAGAHQAVSGDPRITRVGRVLRATALDELPQLWNILRGDMSVVGPRALRPDEIESGGGAAARMPLADVPGFALRSSVRPGLTGVAQIYARRDLPRRQKFRYDKLYIRRQSTWLDLRLVLQSLLISLHGSWERRGKDESVRA